MKRAALIFLLSILTGAVSLAFPWFNPLPQRRPSILLITVDALRPDHLSCYGYERMTSPHIDEVARQGIVFKQAIAPASVTIVSLASFMTSVYPQRHGIITQHLDLNKEITRPTITTTLKAKGYRTAVFLPKDSAIELARWTRHEADYRFAYPLEDGLYDYSFLTQKIKEWVNGDKEKPFFIWIHYRGVHAPYTAPPPYSALFVGDRFYNASRQVPFADNYQGWSGIPKGSQLGTARQVDYYIAQYDGLLNYVDYHIGQLLGFLKGKSLYENTIIVISADHGEAFGEHNLYFAHAFTLYDELLKVPLIIRLPGGKFGGKAYAGQVKLIDVVPTIYEYLRWSIPGNRDGASLLPLITRWGYYKGDYSLSKTDIMNAIRSDEWKLITYDHQLKQELYHLENDPGELTDLYFRERNVAEKLKNKLSTILAGFPCAAVEKTEKIENVSDKQKEVLRSLGYIN